MNRLRHLLRAMAVATFALLIVAAMVAPLASALESADPTSLDEEETTSSLDDPSPSPSLTDSTTSTVEDTTSTVDDTVEIVEETAEELGTAATTAVAPSEEPSEPSDGESPADEPGDDEPARDDGAADEQDDTAAEDDQRRSQDTRGAGNSTREADGPDQRASDREARLRAAAARLARIQASMSQEAFDALHGGPAHEPSGSAPPTRPTDAVDLTAVFTSGPDLSSPVFGGVQAYDGRPGQRSTHDVLSRLSEAGADLATAAKVLAPFPVVGPANYGDDWHAARDGGARLHKGTDIFAPRGTPIVASADGVIGRIGVNSGLGGNTIGLFADDGTYYYYAHLEAFADHVRFNLRVAKGEVIGFVGDSGNAVGTPPHLHFQIHPDNGAPVPPVSYLDRWLQEARAKVLLVRDTAGRDAQLPPLVAPPLGQAGETSAEDADVADPATAEQGSAEPLATERTSHTRQDDPSQAIAVFIALTGVAWYFLRRRPLFAGAGPSTSPEAVTVPDVLEPVLTVEDVVRAGEREQAPSLERDVLQPVLAGREDETDDRSASDSGRDVLADLLS